MSKPTLGGKLMFPSEFVAAEEFNDKDVSLTIKSVKVDSLRTTDGSTEQKPVLYFNETPKKLVLNKTNATQIAQLHGAKAEKWVGKKVTLFPTTCAAFGQTVDCIRIRPTMPQSKPKPQPAQPVPSAVPIRLLAGPGSTKADFDKAVDMSGIDHDTVRTTGGQKLLTHIDNEAWQAAIEMVADMMGTDERTD